MSAFRFLPVAAATALGLAGCAQPSSDAEPGKIDVARAAARGVVRSVVSKPVKVAMTVEHVGEKVAGKLAKNAEDASDKP